MGEDARRYPGGAGVQYLIWAAASEEDLEQAERMLRSRSAYIETRQGDGRTMVEGRDPDDSPVLIAYPGPDQLPLHTLPPRIYAWW
jgi:hypothetical protein